MSSAVSALRVAVYVDGFNLYHAIDDLNQPKLKWLNLWALGKSFCKPDEVLSKVDYFTALSTWDTEKRGRHRQYINAQKAKGVRVVEGNFKEAPRHCPKNKIMCPDREEKQTDVAIAVAMVGDAHDDLFDCAVLVTADTDQLPALRHLTQRFPEKRFRWAAPPNRMKQAREIGLLIPDRLEIDAGRLGGCLLPKIVLDVDGTALAHRPVRYD
ncbi:MAG: NYN domain-containing protein [Terricaulis sp.]|nr:NYN domain-containing protein [Terricaulis sp.]